MKTELFSRRNIAVAIGVTLVGGIGLYWVYFRTGNVPIAQSQSLAGILADVPKRQQRQKDQKSYPADQSMERVDALLADGMMSLADLEAILMELQTPFKISETYFAARNVPESDLTERKEIEETSNAGFRILVNAKLAVWFEKGLAAEDKVREKVIAHLLDVVARPKNEMERGTAFASLNVMGALRETAVRDKAVSGLEASPSAGDHAFISAWKIAETEVARDAKTDTGAK